jgi:hypothetical protein
MFLHDKVRLPILHSHGGGMPFLVLFNLLLESLVLLLYFPDLITELLVLVNKIIYDLLIPWSLCEQCDHLAIIKW